MPLNENEPYQTGAVVTKRSWDTMNSDNNDEKKDLLGSLISNDRVFLLPGANRRGQVETVVQAHKKPRGKSPFSF